MILQTSATTCAAIAAALSFCAAPSHAASLNEALSAYRANRVASAEAMLTEVSVDPAASGEDRAEARRELGRIDWLLRGETDGAAAALVQAKTGADRCRALLISLRVYREAGTPKVAIDQTMRSRGDCSPSEAETMHVSLARALLAQARLEPTDAAKLLAAASAELQSVSDNASRAPLVAATRLSLAMAQRDAEAALAAWRAYFWLDDVDTPQAMAMYAGRVRQVLAAGCAIQAPEGDRAAMVDMLIRAGFVADARVFADVMSDDPLWAHARAYFSFRDAIDNITRRTNRALASGESGDSFQKEVMPALGALAAATGISGDPIEAIAKAYGLYGSIGRTSGYPSLHAGHLVQDERIHVEQYGRAGALRFVVIDNMLANGYESWLWDGWAEAGGWSRGEELIVQVRSAYTSNPLNALNRTRPGPTRDQALAEIDRMRAAERVALGRNGVAELPATGNRVELQAFDQIAKAVGDDDAAFLAEVWRATIQYSIILHEGRHALDKKSGKFADEDLEFRAKLSQISLADFPRLGLANVASSSQADTPHGNANRRVLEGYRTWIRRHRREIDGFDRKTPMLAQLHLLSDKQIRAVARGMDPWAK